MKRINSGKAQLSIFKFKFFKFVKVVLTKTPTRDIRDLCFGLACLLTIGCATVPKAEVPASVQNEAPICSEVREPAQTDSELIEQLADKGLIQGPYACDFFCTEELQPLALDYLCQKICYREAKQ